MDCLDKALWYSRKTEDFPLNPDEIFHAYGTSQGQDYTTHHHNIRIDVQFSRNTTTIPRFRILVLGETGVGKSSLISRVFGVEEMIDLPGASIDHEFTSPQNDKFVLHGSKGFGLKDNLVKIRDFIDHRRNMSPEHQLHAVWLCLETPRTGERFIDKRMEEFLTLKHRGILGNVPVIVVLTKYDRFIDHIQSTLDKTCLKELSNEAIKELAKKNAEAELQNICIRPLGKFAGFNIPHAAISSNEDYKKTLTLLIRITENCVTERSASKAAVMTSIRVAQRVDPELKIKASFEIAKKRYRKTFSCCCAVFKKHKMWNFLHALHTDIIDGWNFYDLHHNLHSQKFRQSISKMVEVEPTKGYRHFFGHAPLIQHFMSYIVNLTLVSQTLYSVSRGQEISHSTIKLAVSSYLASPMRAEARTWIQACDRQLTILDNVDRDKIVEVVQSYSTNATQSFELQPELLGQSSSINIPDAGIPTTSIFSPEIHATRIHRYTRESPRITIEAPRIQRPEFSLLPLHEFTPPRPEILLLPPHASRRPRPEILPPPPHAFKRPRPEILLPPPHEFTLPMPEILLPPQHDFRRPRPEILLPPPHEPTRPMSEILLSPRPILKFPEFSIPEFPLPSGVSSAEIPNTRIPATRISREPRDRRSSTPEWEYVRPRRRDARNISESPDMVERVDVRPRRRGAHSISEFPDMVEQVDVNNATQA
ncbi:uncharacterized protein F5891DRAFT_128942 [Suillus fuscotomentosus]|uniref:G domain-containing protein n=1 Tax=Suillus fuscotomentosus TaxID=1912939 RepID=A0AAD4DQH5_9AGAM|nr:uncharacterized protein F5891DRAFT_128942 [Suillus fuscotomentosus]KAG1889800.1 hypothetical protein F5891DRAFT_128942 [Suillus fuscotomentosus]